MATMRPAALALPNTEAAAVHPRIALARWKPAGEWALGGYPSGVLAPYLGASPQTARRVRTRETDPVTLTLALAADHRGDGARIVSAVSQAFESRFLEVAGSGPDGIARLKDRLGHLVRVGISASYSRYALALYDAVTGREGESLNDAAGAVAARLHELVALRIALGVEGDGR